MPSKINKMANHFHNRNVQQGDEIHAAQSRPHHIMHHFLLNEIRQHAGQHSKQPAIENQVAAISPQLAIDFQKQNIYATPANKDVPMVSAADNDDPVIKAFEETLANYAEEEAMAIHTIGDCARGPRRSYQRVGLQLPVVIATTQGEIVQNSGLFDEVPRNMVRRGDYGVRDWNETLAKAHGINKGDSFIVTRVDASGRLYGANDHFDWVPEDGDRYRNLHFYRPNKKFMRLRSYFAPDDVQANENDA